MPSISLRLRPASAIASGAALLMRSSEEEPSCLPNAVSPTPGMKLILIACPYWSFRMRLRIADRFLAGCEREIHASQSLGAVGGPGNAVAHKGCNFVGGEARFLQDFGAVLIEAWRQPRPFH